MASVLNACKLLLIDEAGDRDLKRSQVYPMTFALKAAGWH